MCLGSGTVVKDRDGDFQSISIQMVVVAMSLAAFI